MVAMVLDPAAAARRGFISRLVRLGRHVRRQLFRQHPVDGGAVEAAGAEGDRAVVYVVRSGRRPVLARRRDRARHYRALVPHAGRRHPDAPSPHRPRRAAEEHRRARAGSRRLGEQRLRGAARRAVSGVRPARPARAGLRAFPAGARLGAVLSRRGPARRGRSAYLPGRRLVRHLLSGHARQLHRHAPCRPVLHADHGPVEPRQLAARGR